MYSTRSARINPLHGKQNTTLNSAEVKASVFRKFRKTDAFSSHVSKALAIAAALYYDKSKLWLYHRNG